MADLFAESAKAEAAKKKVKSSPRRRWCAGLGGAPEGSWLHELKHGQRKARPAPAVRTTYGVGPKRLTDSGRGGAYPDRHKWRRWPAVDEGWLHDALAMQQEQPKAAMTMWPCLWR